MKLIDASTPTRGISLVALVAAMLGGFPLRAADSGKFPAPAKVGMPTKEADLATVTLTADAEKRLGITTAAVVRRKVERTRFFGGEVILPARAAGDDNTNNVGQSVFAILPSLTPADLVRLAQSQIDADGQVEQAKVTLEAARVALARAEQLLRDKAGSARTVDEARSQFSTAEVGLHTARARRDLLGPPVLDIANQPLLWLRVPVYVGDLGKLDTAIEARVGDLAGVPVAASFTARPVIAPPSANAAASTVDLFYELANTNGTFRLGQKVGVTLQLRTEAESLVVPWSAVMHDVYGGTWVYENAGPLTYVRRRVQVSRVAGDDAVLARGVKSGVPVVTAGAAELFGTEFGVGK
jgi:hypothetical protein